VSAIGFLMPDSVMLISCERVSELAPPFKQARLLIVAVSPYFFSPLDRAFVFCNPGSTPLFFLYIFSLTEIRSLFFCSLSAPLRRSLGPHVQRPSSAARATVQLVPFEITLKLRSTDSRTGPNPAEI